MRYLLIDLYTGESTIIDNMPKSRLRGLERVKGDRTVWRGEEEMYILLD